MARNYTGTYNINWREESARHNFPIYQKRWGEVELWKLTMGPKHYEKNGWNKPGVWKPPHDWACYIIKKPDTPLWECKAPHICELIDEDENWERLE